jgi:hypothetical protein
MHHGPIIVAAAFAPHAYVGQGDACNCANFANQAEAQAVLRADPGDPNRLDQGGVLEVACEQNRVPRDTIPVPPRSQPLIRRALGPTLPGVSPRLLQWSRVVL